MIAVMCAWASLLAAYLVFAGETSTAELVAGASGAAAAVLWWVAVRSASGRRFAFEAACWAAAGRACRGLPGATFRTAVKLLRAVVDRDGGEVERRIFAPGRADDAEDTGRRAVGVLATSLAPNSIVLRTPAGRDAIVVHAMTRGEGSPDPRWPI